MTEQIGEIFIRKGKYVTYENINLKIPYNGQVSLQYEIGEENDLVFNKGIELDREILLEFNEGKLIKEK